MVDFAENHTNKFESYVHCIDKEPYKRQIQLSKRSTLVWHK